MASLTNSLNQKLDELSKSSINEIKRLNDLLNKQKEIQASKNALVSLSRLVNDGKTNEKAQVMTDYYKKVINYVEVKIVFWNGVKNKEIPNDMLEKLNEALSEWLDASWIYFGMKEMTSEGDRAKDIISFMKSFEYEYFKKICLIVPKKNKKSCNRKNNKKNRKKN